ncbi:MAG: protein adenylyltransferase SelO [Brevirhabdus sp.]
MTLSIPFDNSYATLPERFFVAMPPDPVSDPQLIRVNTGLAAELGIDADTLASADGVRMLSGNDVPEGAAPLAQIYAGHQFGGWSPQLGDGRAILLGEVIDKSGKRRDIQLKGSGRTPFSRGGDGRAWLGPVIREYVVSEAMHALGVPTTRALAAVATGDWVRREELLPGAVLTRVAASHIRVGTFQYFASQGDEDALKTLLEHASSRHYPHASGALEFLDAVVARQAALIAQWMSLGFIHGVMNTDNMTISGETIDYGPCAFMDEYHPAKVFSSIDQQGRYAFNNQPNMAAWNLAQLATALIPLIDPDADKAVEWATQAVHRFAPIFQAEWLTRFSAKLGLANPQDGDDKLIDAFMGLMNREQADFTNTFRALCNGSARDQFLDRDAYDAWERAWLDRATSEGRTAEIRQAAMCAVNPGLIPRNHRIEETIETARKGDLRPFHRLVDALATPFAPAEADLDLTRPPSEQERVHQTFCGT